MEKIEALQKFLEIDPEEFSEVMEDNDCSFSHGKREYLVLTDDEATELAGNQITDYLWAFNSSFLSGKTGIDEAVFQAIEKNDHCESNNPAILSIIRSTCGLASFQASAILAAGRGRFLATYDNEENEQDEFFIYRTN